MKFSEYKQLKETFSTPKEQALSFLLNVTLSSRLGQQPNKEIIDYLHLSVSNQMYNKLYRGIAVRHTAVSSAIWNGMSHIQVSSSLPEELKRPGHSQTVIHTSKSLSIAQKYSKGGDIDLVYQLMANPNQVLFDSDGISNCFSEGDMDPVKWKYFQDIKEVLLLRDASFENRVIEINHN